MGERGFSMVEALAAMLLVGLVATGIMAAFNAMIHANTRNEIWSDAVVAAEETLEAHRLTDPSALPDSGADPPVMVTVGPRQFSIVTRYCDDATLCTDTARHLIVDVAFNNEQVYSVETVFTKVR